MAEDSAGSIQAYGWCQTRDRAHVPVFSAAASESGAGQHCVSPSPGCWIAVLFSEVIFAGLTSASHYRSARVAEPPLAHVLTISTRTPAAR